MSSEDEENENKEELGKSTEHDTSDSDPFGDDDEEDEVD